MLEKIFPKSIILSKIFIFGIVVKIITSCFFGSIYLRELFIPFSNYFLDSFLNPYEQFIGLNPDSFPYPAGMLYVLSFFKGGISYLLGINSGDLFLYRIPNLIGDYLILRILVLWLPSKERLILFIYWLSPVLFYISYLHGQLDVIPVSILFISLHYLFKRRMLLSALFYGLSLSTKTNVLIALPLILINTYRKQRSKSDVLIYVLVSLLSFIVINLAYIDSNAFIKMVFFNTTQSQLFESFFQFNKDYLFYFIPFLLFCMILFCLKIKSMNRDLTLMFLGFSFCIINVFIVPMQGWYYWFLPFLIYFGIKFKDQSFILFLFFIQLLYFLFFGLSITSDFLILYNPVLTITIFELLEGVGIDDGLLTVMLNLIFTLLQGGLLILCYWLYKNGIAEIFKRKLAYKPYFVGIAGPSGAGKTTLSSLLNDIFCPQNTLTICGDGVHKWERGDENWNELSHLNPKANFLHLDALNLSKLRKGIKIKRRSYEHEDGRFSLEENIVVKKAVIYEGLHALYLKKSRECYDLKIYVAPDESLRRQWKVKRDTQKRKKSKEEVLSQMKDRENDFDSFIKGQSDFADIQIKFFEENKKSGLKVKVINDVECDVLVGEFKKIKTLEVEHTYEGEYQSLKFVGTIDLSSILRIKNKTLVSLEEFGIFEDKWSDNYEGILQLIIFCYIINHD